MSMDREAVRALNCLARESLGYFGRADGPALANSLQDYFVGMTLPMNLRVSTCTLALVPYFTLSLLLDEAEEELSMNCDGTVELLYYKNK